MTYETSPFGDGVVVGSGGNVKQNVHNHYGPRYPGNVVGALHTEGASNEVSFDINGPMLAAGKFALLPPVLPKGAVIAAVFLKTEEAFVLGGSTPVIEVGTEGTEATNGFSITETQAETPGTYNLTSALSGTWASPLAADTTVGISLEGTNPTVTDAGKAKVVIRYSYVPK